MKLNHTQHGAALIILLIALILAGGVFLLNSLPDDTGRVTDENRTSQALARARQAVIAYAVSYYYTAAGHAGHHGFLPCPETTNSSEDGRSVLNCAIGGSRYVNQLGRLPWKTLQIDPPTDSAGECLWYAMSGSYSPSPRAELLNADTPGMFQIFQQNGQLQQGALPEDRVVAVIIAPGEPLANQNRGNATPGLPCKRARDQVAIADYLENFNGISNTSVSDIVPDQVDSFIASTALTDNPAINDRLITITAGDIFDVIKANDAFYKDKIQQFGETLAGCMITFAQSATGCQCYTDCNDQFTICDASATTGKEHAQCIKDRNECRKDCRPQCGTGQGQGQSQGKGKGKGQGNQGGNTLPLLPWPAPINLAADFRDDNSYDDLSNAAEGYLGRLPNLIGDSASAMGVTDTSLFDSCNLTADAEMHALWQNWKDHWFYVVGQDFAPNGSSPANCTQCPEVSGTRYAAVLIFAEERLNNQLRRTNETEDPDPPLAETKAIISNYLEGSNASNYPDNDGSGSYGVNNINDRLFCIEQDLSVITECTP